MRLILTSDLHRDGSKLSWLLEVELDALLVAGDHLDLFSRTPFEDQISGTLRWMRLIQESGKSFAWCSGNHDFFQGEKTPISGASPKWMKKLTSSARCVSDGESRLLEVGDGKIAVTTIPWWVPGTTLMIDGLRMNYQDFTRKLLQTGKKLQTEEGVPWIVLCHQPPGETPLCGNATSPEADFVRRMIEAAEPDFSLHGHIHEAPTNPGGSWIWQQGKTTYFNPGQSDYNETPYYILLECFGDGKWSAIWNGNGQILRAEWHKKPCYK